MKNLHRILFYAAVGLHVIVATMNIRAQEPDWIWAKAPDGQGRINDLGRAIATDASGNVYVTGSYRGSSTTFGTTKLANVDYDAIFIVKYDPSGNVLWAKSAGGGGNKQDNADDESYSVATDGSGNVYITGKYSSSSITFGSATLTNSGVGADIFIVKYDPNGNVLWAKSAGGDFADDFGNSIAADNSGNVYVTGEFSSSSLTFGTTNITNSGSTNSGSHDIFIVKYDPNGNVVWAKSAAGGKGEYEYAKSISLDGSGNIFVTGDFTGSVTFGTITLKNTATTSRDIFIAKYDPNGNVLWAKSAGGSNFEKATSSNTDKSGNLYITGSFISSSIKFGTIELTNAKTGNQTGDVFIAKYDANGNVLWAKSAGGIYVDEGYSITTDENENVYVTGGFSSPSITLGTYTLTNATGFIVKYNSAGNVLWAKSVNGGDFSETIAGITTDKKGNIYMTGYFHGPTLAFGNIVLNLGTFAENMFIAKLGTSSTAVYEESADIVLSTFPNPNSGSFTLSGTEQGEFQITVYSLEGERVYQSILNSYKSTITLSGQAAGTYFYQLKKDGRILKTGKIVIE